MMMMTKMTMSHGFDDDNEELMMIMLMMTTKMKMSHSSVLKQVKLSCNRRGLQTSFPKAAYQSPQHAKPPITVSKKKRCHSSADSPQHSRLSQTVSFFGEDSKLSDQQDVRPCSAVPALLLCGLCRWQDRPHRWPLQVQGRASQVNFS